MGVLTAIGVSLAWPKAGAADGSGRMAGGTTVTGALAGRCRGGRTGCMGGIPGIVPREGAAALGALEAGEGSPGAATDWGGACTGRGATAACTGAAATWAAAGEKL